MAKRKGVKLGGTGRFPYGKAREDDEGELTLAMRANYAQNIVEIDFGVSVEWLGIPAAQAREFGQALIAKADELDRRKT